MACSTHGNPIISATSAAAPAALRTLFHRVQLETYSAQRVAVLGALGSSLAITSFFGTLKAIVTAKVPTTYNTAPNTRQAAPCSCQRHRESAASAAHASAVPANTLKKTRLSTTTLMDCIAATPRAGGKRSSAFITKFENAKKTPALSPEPSAHDSVRT